MIPGRRLAVLALAMAFSLVWSSAFIAGKIALANLDPSSTLSLRFALSAAVLLPFAARGGRREAGLGLALGALNNVAYLGLTFWALTYTRATVVVAIVSCAPFTTAGLAAILGIERVAPRQLAGALIGLGGVLLLTGFDRSSASAAGAGLAAAGTLAFSLATLLFRARAAGASIPALNFWQSLAGALSLAPFAWMYGRGLQAVATPDVLAIVYLALVVTIGGMAMWFALIRVSGAAGASAYHLMNPFFGALLSALVLGTPLRAMDFVGAALIALGLALTTGANETRAISAIDSSR